MTWRRVLGVLAVLLVLGTVLGTVASLVSINDLLLGSGEQAAAGVTLAVVTAGLLATVVLGGPKRQWLDNPYW